MSEREHDPSNPATDRTVVEADRTQADSMDATTGFSWNSAARTSFAEEAVEIPGYRIDEAIGHGGASVVYRAQQIASGRPVALKVLRPSITADSCVRFLQEADILRRLKHPNIVELIDAGWYGRKLFLAMELVTGGTLEQRISGKPQNARRSAEVVMRIATGVEQAHRLGIIHRDLKPSNVLMSLTEPSPSGDLQGFPKVADFGVARLHQCGGTLTATGDVIGTPSYMPPEQFEGRKKDIGFASDVYTLGAILYELLTGRPPFRSRSLLALFREIVQEPPPRPRSIVADLHLALEAICLKCLDKNPARRIPTAADLAGELRRILDVLPAC